MKFSDRQTHALAQIAQLRELIRQICPDGAEVDILISFQERPEWNIKIGMKSISAIRAVLDTLREAATDVVIVEAGKAKIIGKEELQ